MFIVIEIVVKHLESSHLPLCKRIVAHYGGIIAAQIAQVAQPVLFQ